MLYLCISLIIKIFTTMENKTFKVRNVCITKENREYYKYIVIRECENYRGVMEYWYYMFTNDLYEATMAMREIGNGIVLELENVVGEENNC